jgi:hypothetical protein
LWLIAEVIILDCCDFIELDISILEDCQLVRGIATEWPIGDISVRLEVGTGPVVLGPGKLSWYNRRAG